MDCKVGQMSAATADKKAAETERRAAALRANLRRRKTGRRVVLDEAAAGHPTRDDETRG